MDVNEFVLFNSIVKIPKNHKLIDDFSKEMNTSYIINKYDLDTSEYSEEEIILFIAYKFLNQSVFDFCQIAHRHHDKPIKVISWFKSEISKYEEKLRKPIIKYTIRVLEDNDRFPFDSTIIVNGIKDIIITENYKWIEQNEFAFFLNSDKMDFDSWFKSIMQIWGLWKTDKEKIEEFISEYYSKEFIEIANKYIPQSHALSLSTSDIVVQYKIDWKKDERLIPYLIHLLNESGFIAEKNQFSFIEKHFTVNSKAIKRENLKANYFQADYLNKSISKSPKEIKQLNELIEQLKTLLNAL